jgi:hypothetical protein
MEDTVMKAANAIRQFMNQGVKEGLYSTVTVSEIKDFKEVCTDQEWQEFGKQACAIMGEVYEPAG